MHCIVGLHSERLHLVYNSNYLTSTMDGLTLPFHPPTSLNNVIGLIQLALLLTDWLPQLANYPIYFQFWILVISFIKIKFIINWFKLNLHYLMWSYVIFEKLVLISHIYYIFYKCNLCKRFNMDWVSCSNAFWRLVAFS